MSEPLGVGAVPLGVGAARLLGRQVPLLIAVSLVALPIGLLTSACGVGIPVVMWVHGRLTHAMLTAAYEEAGHRAPLLAGAWRAGAMVTAALLVLIGGQALGAMLALSLLGPSLVELGGPTLAAALAGLVALMLSLVMGAALVPFAFAPFFSAQAEPGLLPPLARSFALAARLGSGRVARFGARAGLVVGLAPALALGVALSLEEPTSLALLLLPFAVVVGPPIVLAWLARIYLRARSEAPRPVEAVPELRSLLLALVPTLAIAAAAFLLAAATPTRMTPMEGRRVERGFHIGRAVAVRAEAVRLPGTDLYVRADRQGVVVEAADGGGAGAIRAPFEVDEVDDAAVVARPATEHGVQGFVIDYSDGTRWARVFVDRDGVRSDDGLTARVSARLGRVGLGALSLALLALLGVAWVVGVELTAARTIEAPRLDEPGGDGRRRALEGVLRLAPGARASGWPKGFTVEGEAWVEALGGEVRLRLPAGARYLAGATGPLKDGAPLTVLSHFSELAPRGPRDSSSPWPVDAVVIVGAREDAQRALVARAARLAATLGAASVLGFLVAVGLLVTAI